MTFRIAFFADSHIGYSQPNVRTNARGYNLRLVDGYEAFKETLNQIVSNDPKIDAIIHGGDLFHSAKPTILDIVFVQDLLRKLSERHIPFYGLAGNHDASDIRTDLPAVAAVNEPDRNIHALYQPYKKFELADGLILHSVSHHGLGHDAPEVIAVEGALNIFTTHGSAYDPKNKALLQCLDSPREQKVPNELVTDPNFILKLLGHYHSRYPVGGKELNTWYSGSSVRRGFSDEPGDRGWLLISIEPNGAIKVEPKNIHQRPQYDLQAIDAEGLGSAEVMDLLELNMKRTMEAEEAPIVRQRILNAPLSIREGLDRDKIASMSGHMLSWQLEYPKAKDIPLPPTEDGAPAKPKEPEGPTLASRYSVNIVNQYDRWLKNMTKQYPEEFAEAIESEAKQHLVAAQAAMGGDR